LGLVVLAAALLTLGVAALAHAFHSGGVAECEGCHSMHSPAAGGSSLLVGTTASEACLTCHEHAGDTGPSSYHVSTAIGELSQAGLPPKQRTPGGDFGWVKLSFSYPSGGNTVIEPGDSHGHNVVAPANNLNADAHNTTAPGGTFAAGNLQCTSCHDPHGKYRRDSTGTVAPTGQPIKASGSYNGTGNEPTAAESVGVYRLLAGLNYSFVVNNGQPIAPGFRGVPAAKAPSTYNQSEATNQVRVAYGVATTGGHTTWGDWCATCHGNMHSDGNYVHPVDTGLGSTLGNYNAYVKSGDLTGQSASSYLSLVPFVTNSGDYNILAGLASNATATSAGPGSGDQVTCLSCHRAHASGFTHMLRFDQGYEFTTKGGQYIGSDNPEVTGSRAGVQHRGRTNAMWQAAYYDRSPSQFASYQRVLCNKCHAKD
jgi:hypothetical protein